MATDWMQQQISRLLAEAADAISRLDWETVSQRARAVIALDPENVDGLALLAAAQRASGTAPPSSGVSAPPQQAPPGQPTSFSNGRFS